MSPIIKGCKTEDCSFHKNGECTQDEITIDDAYECEQFEYSEDTNAEEGSEIETAEDDNLSE